MIRQVKSALQPHPLTSAMQLAITAASVFVAAAAISFIVKTSSDERNARLVEIGVSVLRADPTKGQQIPSAREWAINLIDQNSGGVKFSSEARAALLQKPLDFEPYTSYGGYSDYKSYGGYLEQKANGPQSKK